MLQCSCVPHYTLQDYLKSTGPAGVFSRYVANRLPDAISAAVLDGDRVVGTAIAGRTFGLYEAYPHWILADTAEAAELLAHHLLISDRVVNAPQAFLKPLQQLYERQQFSTDCLYLLKPSQFRPISHSQQVRVLTTPELQQLELPEELHAFLGNLDDWQGSMQLYGIVEAGRLCCIADMIVHDQDYTVIQQLYTITSYRGQGLAQRLVSTMAEQILQQRKTPVYVAAEDNAPSRAIAEKLGFSLDAQWVFISEQE